MSKCKPSQAHLTAKNRSLKKILGHCYQREGVSSTKWAGSGSRCWGSHWWAGRGSRCTLRLSCGGVGTLRWCRPHGKPAGHDDSFNPVAEFGFGWTSPKVGAQSPAERNWLWALGWCWRLVVWRGWSWLLPGAAVGECWSESVDRACLCVFIPPVALPCCPPGFPLSPPLPSNPLRTTRVAGPRLLFTHKGTQSHRAPQPWVRSFVGGGEQVFQDWTNSLGLPQSEQQCSGCCWGRCVTFLTAVQLVSSFSLIKDTQSQQRCSLALVLPVRAVRVTQIQIRFRGKLRVRTGRRGSVFWWNWSHPAVEAKSRRSPVIL